MKEETKGIMSKHKISSTPQAVPFSWEQLPGISKVSPRIDEDPKPVLVPRPTELRPPPISSPHVNPKSMEPGFYIPLPPCRFQPNQMQTRKGVKRPEEDPFLAAFIECTKPVEQKRPPKGEKKTVRRNSWPRLERLGLGLGLGLSCKSSCGVREGNLIKMSKLPEIDRDSVFEW
ncbi:Glutamine synthetase [Rhynchospora pubera]|uniref:Glutamine synthetase n=1 Tax=Rhynchospora pubera TaxID=906938 RepID=A0AAV8EIY3_9POAL|nr:Glutamine synthetase [Rhynchospora pubera]KAJ4804353.1 Glutamine synthetase [Rhynchospora pubera]